MTSSTTRPETLRIHVWSSPRNLSTALMYSWRQRPDTTVVDEPLYAHYLAASGADHPGRDTVLDAQAIDAETVIEDVILADHGTPVVFFKQMAKHLIGISPARRTEVFFDRGRNVLLTRDPYDMLTSFQVRVPHATTAETGFRELVELLHQIRESGSEPIVIDSKLLLADPPRVLAEMCRRLGLDFDPAMLTWPAGPKPEDGVWAEYWYDGVHASTGFVQRKPKQATLLPHLQTVLDEVEPLYQQLLPWCIGAES